MKLGEPDASGRRRPIPIKGCEFTVEYDSVIAAIGQVPQVPEAFGVKTSRGSTIQTDKSLATSRQGVFAGGDVQRGPASVIEAIAQGRLAASSIDSYLGGNGVIEEVLVEPDEVSDFLGREEGFAAKKAPRMPMIADEERLKGRGEAEVETGYHQDVAIAEARRCLRCEMRLKVCCPPKVPKRVAEEVGAEVY